MKHDTRGLFSGLLFELVWLSAALTGVAFTEAEAREQPLIEWRFHLGDIAGAQVPVFADDSWRKVQVPHDWSIEAVPDPEAPSAGGDGFFPTGIGWYRTSFECLETMQDRHVELVFDGVYRRAEVWINGVNLGKHAYGYTQFRFDLTPHLQAGKPNTLAVKVDNHAQPNSRWYSGSGIYRPVWLEISDPVRLEPNSLFVQTRSLSESGDTAVIRIEGRLLNDSDVAINRPVQFALESETGDRMVFESESLPIKPGEMRDFSIDKTIGHPLLWTPDSPHLYQLRISLNKETPSDSDACLAVGIRKVQVSAQHGLLINGKSQLLLGGNVHHDHGPLGAAAYPEAERRKVALLKAAGFNAVRTSHNPPSRVFLDECDRQGLWVLDEAFDMWKAGKLAQDYSKDWDACWADDVRAMVLRDRNHPSVMMWSMGNEVYERTSADGLRRGHELAAEVRVCDPTRPVTIGLNGAGAKGEWSDLDGIFAAFDVAGYNYEIHRYLEDHQRLPNRIMFAAESYLGSAYENWKRMTSAPWVIGDFVWSAMDYLGEAGIGKVFNPDETVVPHWEGNHYPWHGAYCGDIDLTGWRKPISHYRQIVWDTGEKLYAAVEIPAPAGVNNDGGWNVSQWGTMPLQATWDWPECDGKPVKLSVYSRYEQVQVWLNGEMVAESQGLQHSAFQAVFELDYVPGILRVAGLQAGQEMEVVELKTPGVPERFQWKQPDLTDLRSRKEDALVFVELQLVDREGNPIRRSHSDRNVELEVNGEAVILGIASGDMSDASGYQVKRKKSFEGRLLVVVKKLNPDAGACELIVRSEGLSTTTYTL